MAAEVARKTIYCFAPPRGWNVSQGEAMFFLPDKDWKYRFAYRNIVTGHVSDATPHVAQLVHTFIYPDMDVVDIYRQMQDGSFNYAETVGAWGTKG
jgi:hypothetical protein